MTHPTFKLSAAIAAALMLSCGGALAANVNDHPNPQTTNQPSVNQQTTPQQYTEHQSTGQQSADQQYGDQASASDQSSDSYREGQLWATYVLNPALQAYRIDGDIQGNTATLTGTVESKTEKLLAAALAQQVEGVTTVRNNIQVDPARIVVTTFIPGNVFAQQVRDMTTSAEVDSQLMWNEYTDALDIDVATQDGKVTLTGTADTEKAKQRATRIAANTQGVQSVDNQLSVSGNNIPEAPGEENDEWITDKVQSSLGFTAGMDPTDIEVGTTNGVVTLAGTVDSQTQRQQAINIAQDTVGVEGVKAGQLQVASRSNDSVAIN
ncbi:MAG TPA: BON domain-containing protein [Oleiagrimonas sp.]|nr:BON domain-containing protein [Oleiagrimonas sp.]